MARQKLADAEHHRRFDVVCYLNGLPVIIAELKQGGLANATLASARPTGHLPGRVRPGLPSLRRDHIGDGVTAAYGT